MILLKFIFIILYLTYLFKILMYSQYSDNEFTYNLSIFIKINMILFLFLGFHMILYINL